MGSGIVSYGYTWSMVGSDGYVNVRALMGHVIGIITMGAQQRMRHADT